MTTGARPSLGQILDPAPRPVVRSEASQLELVWPGKREIKPSDLIHPVQKRDGRVLVLSSGSGAVGAGISLIHGDNSAAMAVLLAGTDSQESLAGKVKLCYIDPPYNTGSQFSTYGDSKASSVWLEELRERLIYIRTLLASDGSVWVQLDDREQHHARVVMDEVFGRDAFVSTIVWQKRTSRDNRTAFSSAHDYIHVYAAMGSKAWRNVRNGLPDMGSFSNPDQDPRGSWRSTPMSAQAGHATKSQFYTVTTPTGATHEPPPGRCWTYTKERLAQLDADGFVYWPRAGAGRPRLKRYEHEVTELAPSTIWLADSVGDNAEAKKELLREFPGRSAFDTPKPERLMERIVSIATNPDELVLDCYMGSGTTGVAAAKLGRRFIGIESSEMVVKEIARPRIARRVDSSVDSFSVFELHSNSRK